MFFISDSGLIRCRLHGGVYGSTVGVEGLGFCSDFFQGLGVLLLWVVAPPQQKLKDLVVEGGSSMDKAAGERE